MPSRLLVLAVIFTSYTVAEPRAAGAQDFSPAITVSAGFIESPQWYARHRDRAFFPQVEASIVLLEGKTGLSLLGGAYVGGWRAGADDTPDCADCIIYSFSSITAGARVGVSLDYFPLPISIWSGVSRHLIFAEYVRGAGVAGNIGEDYRDEYTALETGVRLQVPLGDRVQVGGDLQGQLPLTSSDDPHRARVRYGMAVTYAL